MLQLVNEINNTQSVIYLIQPNVSAPNNLPDYIQPVYQNFINTEANEEFVKIGTQFFFFIKENKDLEKLRVAGYNVRQKLDKNTTEITLVGNDEQALALAEGLALSNYQFLKYFSDADVKEYQLEAINMVTDLTAQEINEMNQVIQAVIWARDMVNEPSSYLSAVQLAREIQEIGDEAHLNVQVLNKKTIQDLKMGGLLAVNL